MISNEFFERELKLKPRQSKFDKIGGVTIYGKTSKRVDLTV